MFKYIRIHLPSKTLCCIEWNDSLPQHVSRIISETISPIECTGEQFQKLSCQQQQSNITNHRSHQFQTRLQHAIITASTAVEAVSAAPRWLWRVSIEDRCCERASQRVRASLHRQAHNT